MLQNITPALTPAHHYPSNNFPQLPHSSASALLWTRAQGALIVIHDNSSLTNAKKNSKQEGVSRELTDQRNASKVPASTWSEEIRYSREACFLTSRLFLLFGFAFKLYQMREISGT